MGRTRRPDRERALSDTDRRLLQDQWDPRLKGAVERVCRWYCAEHPGTDFKDAVQVLTLHILVYRRYKVKKGRVVLNKKKFLYDDLSGGMRKLQQLEVPRDQYPEEDELTVFDTTPPVLGVPEEEGRPGQKPMCPLCASPCAIHRRPTEREWLRIEKRVWQNERIRFLARLHPGCPCNTLYRHKHFKAVST